MERWQALFDEFRAHEAERLEHERRARELEAQRRDLEDWSRRAIGWLLTALVEEVEKRADELALRAGVRISVKPTRRAPARHPRAEVTYIELSRESDTIFIYAYHELGHLPLVHFLMPSYDGFLERAKHARLISLPGCRVARADDDRVLLQRIDPEGSSAPEPETTIDDLAFRAFELLLRGRCARRAKAVELLPGAETVIYGSPSASA